MSPTQKETKPEMKTECKPSAVEWQSSKVQSILVGNFIFLLLSLHCGSARKHWAKTQKGKKGKDLLKMILL